MKTKNLYKVNKKRWNSMSELARMVFNGLYKSMIASPFVFHTHKLLIQRTWKITAWNTAWIAADEVMAGQKAIEKAFTDKAMKYVFPKNWGKLESKTR